MLSRNRIFTIQKIFAFTLTTLLSGMISCKDDDQQPAPQATSITPNSGFPGSVAVIRGSFFNSESADNIVTFNGKVASIMQATQQQLDVIVPADADTGPVAIVVTVKGQSLLPASLFIPLCQLIAPLLPLALRKADTIRRYR